MAGGPPIWPPIILTYGIIIGSLSLLAGITYMRFALFRTWFAEPLNRWFWFPWLQLVVCSGGSIAMMLFPGADGVMGWGMLRYDGAFTGPAWIAANEVQTQIIVLCFTAAALVNQPPALTELFLTFSHPAEVGTLFPRPLTMAQRRTFLALANANCVFMYPLTFSTWMIPVERRPFWYTAIFLPLSLGSGIAAGIYLARTTPKAGGVGPSGHSSTLGTIEVTLKREQSKTLIRTKDGEEEHYHVASENTRQTHTAGGYT